MNITFSDYDNLIDRAAGFAVKAHSGQFRKDKVTPYIVHPFEVAAIIAGITPDPEIIAAGLLHDTVEDTGTTPEQIKAEFGARVAGLVASETENKRRDLPSDATWKVRKEESLEVLRNTSDKGVKILWLADKLSNMRSFYRMHLDIGDKMWSRFHQHDPAEHEWYYRSVAEALAELSGTAAYAEYCGLVNKLFNK